jgi:adenosylcobinamide-GDP ribazoletransferase
VGDAWRLAVGTLTAIPVRPPARVDRRTSTAAMLLAPVTVLPLGILVAGLTWIGQLAALAPLPVAFLTVGALALGSRALHWDGLSDTVDGLTASYDRDRALQVMRSGTAGPAGVVAVVVVAGVQATSLAALTGSAKGAVLGGALVCASRCALVLTCRAGVPGARKDGLGSPSAGTVPSIGAWGTWVVVVGLVAALAAWAGLEWWRGLVAAALACLVVVLLLRVAVRRLGGVTGDVYGASIELALATLLLGLV